VHPSIDLGFTTLPSYFTLLMVGITAATLLAHREGMRRGLDGNTILDLGLLMLLAGLVGARVLHVFVDGHFTDYVNLCLDPDALPGLALAPGAACADDAQCLAAGLGDRCDAATGLCRQQRDCLRTLKIWYGGYVFYGGLLLAVPLGIWFLRRRRTPVWAVADLAGWAIPFGLVLGRLGCFLAGCCFGAHTDAPIGLAFPRLSPAWQQQLDAHLIDASAAQALPVHATQLYEAVAAGLISAWLFVRDRRGAAFQGAIFFEFLLLYGIFRFAVEFLRADERGAWLGGLLSTSQIVSLPLIVVGAWVLWRRRPWPDLDAAHRGGG
jgi:phosphatidylglycerol:prolipoprotein diacylglycerol transferase